MRIVFEFIGGPRDGERLTGCSEDLATEAGSLYRQTGRATVGYRFWCTCEYSVTALRTIPWVDIEQLEEAGYRFRGHVYQIADCVKREESVVARVRHLFPSE